jgi:hypothetical protein
LRSASDVEALGFERKCCCVGIHKRWG